MIRPATADEHDFCRATWLSGLLRGCRASRSKRDRTRATIDRLLATQRTIVDTRPGTSRPEDVIGWCCFTPLQTTSVLHFVYVRTAHGGAELRRRGVATGLVRAAGVDLSRIVPYTHATDLLPALLRTAGLRATSIAVSDVL